MKTTATTTEMKSKVSILETSTLAHLHGLCVLQQAGDNRGGSHYNNNRNGSSNKSRKISVLCVDFLIKHLRSQLDKEFDAFNIFWDGCAAQFQFRYAFRMVTEIQKDVNIT